MAPDANTVACTIWNTIGDSSGAVGGPSHGVRKYGGVINRPEWTDDTVWYVPPPTPTPTATPCPDVVARADVRGMGAVNVLDVQAIANIVLTG